MKKQLPLIVFILLILPFAVTAQTTFKKLVGTDVGSSNRISGDQFGLNKDFLTRAILGQDSFVSKASVQLRPIDESSADLQLSHNVNFATDRLLVDWVENLDQRYRPGELLAFFSRKRAKELREDLYNFREEMERLFWEAILKPPILDQEEMKMTLELLVIRD